MPDAGYLTIGKVVKRLQVQYPDLSVSKVRYLEDEGLLTPSRTPGGYRLYSQHDIRRLETILYLQKNRFMPLQVIKDELAKGDGALTPLLAGGPDAPGGTVAPGESAGLAAGSDLGAASRAGIGEERPSRGDAFAKDGAESDGPLSHPQDSAEVLEKYHPLSRMPELLGVSVAFVRELSVAGVITMRRSPHGRDLVDGHDFPLIRVCEELRQFGIGPKNLRQYVQAANRESGMFEQALTVYGRNASGGRAAEPSPEQKERREQAFSRMIDLTNAVRASLIRKSMRGSGKDGNS